MGTEDLSGKPQTETKTGLKLIQANREEILASLEPILQTCQERGLLRKGLSGEIRIKEGLSVNVHQQADGFSVDLNRLVHHPELGDLAEGITFWVESMVNHQGSFRLKFGGWLGETGEIVSSSPSMLDIKTNTLVAINGSNIEKEERLELFENQSRARVSLAASPKISVRYPEDSNSLIPAGTVDFEFHPFNGCIQLTEENSISTSVIQQAENLAKQLTKNTEVLAPQFPQNFDSPSFLRRVIQEVQSTLKTFNLEIQAKFPLLQS